MITKQQIEEAMFEQVFHGNMGFVADDTAERHKGFIYGFTCTNYPRFQMTKAHYTLDDGQMVTEYFVDGEKVEDLEAAVIALNKPVELQHDERKALSMIPTSPIDLRLMEDMLAGCERPDSCAIMPNSPHAWAWSMIDRLRNKGVVKIGRREWDDLPEDQDEIGGIPKGLRFSPTIMRVG